jgi:hypothetical protein
LTAFTLTVMSSSTSTAVMTTSTYATPEFGAGQTVILSTMFVAVILVLIRRNLSRKR